MLRISSFIKFCLFTCLATYFANCSATDLSNRSDIQDYIKQLSAVYNFNQQQLQDWFTKAQIKPDIIAKMNRQYEAQPWYIYRKALITSPRVQQGVKFWNANAAVLKAAESRYGVPANIIVAIIGVETSYGANKGNYFIMDALTTLAFDYPRRANFFKNELTQFLLLSREQKWDPLSVKGSYAGAMGFPQFMPSSYRKYAVDYDNDGRKDLLSDQNDVIMSIANYLRVNGWQPNQPVASLTKIRENRKLNEINKIHYTLHQLASLGIIAKSPYSSNLKAGVLSLDDEHAMQHWLIFNNFKVITYYNSSSKYAMAVYELGQAISKARAKTLKNKYKQYEVAENNTSPI